MFATFASVEDAKRVSSVHTSLPHSELSPSSPAGSGEAAPAGGPGLEIGGGVCQRQTPSPAGSPVRKPCESSLSTLSSLSSGSGGRSEENEDALPSPKPVM